MKKLLIIILLLGSGCASKTNIYINGKDVRIPIGFSSLKATDASVYLKRDACVGMFYCDH